MFEQFCLYVVVFFFAMAMPALHGNIKPILEAILVQLLGYMSMLFCIVVACLSSSVCKQWWLLCFMLLDVDVCLFHICDCTCVFRRFKTNQVDIRMHMQHAQTQPHSSTCTHAWCVHPHAQAQRHHWHNCSNALAHVHMHTCTCTCMHISSAMLLFNADSESLKCKV